MKTRGMNSNIPIEKMYLNEKRNSLVSIPKIVMETITDNRVIVGNIAFM